MKPLKKILQNNLKIKAIAITIITIFVASTFSNPVNIAMAIENEPRPTPVEIVYCKSGLVGEKTDDKGNKMYAHWVSIGEFPQVRWWRNKPITDYPLKLEVKNGGIVDIETFEPDTVEKSSDLKTVKVMESTVFVVYTTGNNPLLEIKWSGDSVDEWLIEDKGTCDCYNLVKGIQLGSMRALALYGKAMEEAYNEFEKEVVYQSMVGKTFIVPDEIEASLLALPAFVWQRGSAERAFGAAVATGLESGDWMFQVLSSSEYEQMLKFIIERSQANPNVETGGAFVQLFSADGTGAGFKVLGKNGWGGSTFVRLDDVKAAGRTMGRVRFTFHIHPEYVYHPITGQYLGPGNLEISVGDFLEAYSIAVENNQRHVVDIIGKYNSRQITAEMRTYILDISKLDWADRQLIADADRSYYEIVSRLRAQHPNFNQNQLDALLWDQWSQTREYQALKRALGIEWRENSKLLTEKLHDIRAEFTNGVFTEGKPFLNSFYAKHLYKLSQNMEQLENLYKELVDDEIGVDEFKEVVENTLTYIKDLRGKIEQFRLQETRTEAQKLQVRLLKMELDLAKMKSSSKGQLINLQETFVDLIQENRKALEDMKGGILDLVEDINQFMIGEEDSSLMQKLMGKMGSLKNRISGKIESAKKVLGLSTDHLKDLKLKEKIKDFLTIEKLGPFLGATVVASVVSAFTDVIIKYGIGELVGEYYRNDDDKINTFYFATFIVEIAVGLITFAIALTVLAPLIPAIAVGLSLAASVVAGVISFGIGIVIFFVVTLVLTYIIKEIWKCEGNISIDKFSPALPIKPGQPVAVSIDGLAHCVEKTIYVKLGDHCTPEANEGETILGTCTYEPARKGCLAVLDTSQLDEGDYKIVACIDKNNDCYFTGEGESTNSVLSISAGGTEISQECRSGNCEKCASKEECDAMIYKNCKWSEASKGCFFKCGDYESKEGCTTAGCKWCGCECTEHDEHGHTTICKLYIPKEDCKNQPLETCSWKGCLEGEVKAETASGDKMSCTKENDKSWICKSLINSDIKCTHEFENKNMWYCSTI